jgi:hypothetical protein
MTDLEDNVVRIGGPLVTENVIREIRIVSVSLYSALLSPE